MADRDKQDRHPHRESPSRTGILSDPKAISGCRRNTIDSLGNSKSKLPACGKVIVALCASLKEAWQQVPSTRTL
jgi:hypothetical protein